MLARDDALLTCALWMGLLQLQQSVPDPVGDAADSRSFLEAANRLLEHLLATD